MQQQQQNPRLDLSKRTVHNTQYTKGQLMTRGIFVGLSTIDIVYNVDEFPEFNTKIEANSQGLYAGGPAANASIVFSHLGGEALLVSAVGRHPLAALIREELARYEVRLIDLYPDYGGAPALSSVAVDRKGNRNVISANAKRISIPFPEADKDACEDASVLLVDGHSMPACLAWAKAAHAQGTPVVFDGGSWKTGTEQLLQYVDTAICSADFLPPGCDSENETLHYLQQTGVTSIAITHGSKPVRYLLGERSGTVPVPCAETVDTMGAGDIFHGSFCYFASTGHGFIEALELAARIAAKSCQFRGTREWMKNSMMAM
jgi:sugar/nucleoside kinase (ribokinase family)